MAVSRRTKIIATVGPACQTVDALAAMIEAGMDVARLNFSHGSLEQHAGAVANIRAASELVGREVAILQDLPGPKLRLGTFRTGGADLAVGDPVTLLAGSDELGEDDRLPVTWPDFASAVEKGDPIFLADGAIRLAAGRVRAESGEIEAIVEVGGSLRSRQGINLPHAADRLPSFGPHDIDCLEVGAELGVDLVALSFVRRSEDVEALRAHTQLPIVAKIENTAAVSDAERIIEAADGVMVARGDLGIELPIEALPLIQKDLITMAGGLARPVVTATQMLESMVDATRPTRAEVTDVANAILDGTDALMLSQETAVGAHPVRAVAMMASIAVRTERASPLARWSEERVRRLPRVEQETANTLAYSASAAAHQLDLAALIVPTLSGRSVRLISAHRPPVPIYALSPNPETVRRCAPLWGVEAALIDRHETTEGLIAASVARAAELGWVEYGDQVAVTAGLPSSGPGSTSLLQVQTVPVAGGFGVLDERTRPAAAPA